MNTIHKEVSKKGFLALPNEILEIIADFGDARLRSAMMGTCHTIRNALYSESKFQEHHQLTFKDHTIEQGNRASIRFYGVNMKGDSKGIFNYGIFQGYETTYTHQEIKDPKEALFRSAAFEEYEAINDEIKRLEQRISQLKCHRANIKKMATTKCSYKKVMKPPKRREYKEGEWVINSITGRKVKIGSKTHQKLVAQGVRLDKW